MFEYDENDNKFMTLTYKWNQEYWYDNCRENYTPI